MSNIREGKGVSEWEITKRSRGNLVELIPTGLMWKADQRLESKGVGKHLIEYQGTQIPLISIVANIRPGTAKAIAGVPRPS